MHCQIIRKKLVKSYKWNLSLGTQSDHQQKWITEACNSPLFSSDKSDIVCKQCAEGWTHENNFMVDNEFNKKLLLAHKIKLTKH